MKGKIYFLPFSTIYKKEIMSYEAELSGLRGFQLPSPTNVLPPNVLPAYNINEISNLTDIPANFLIYNTTDKRLMIWDADLNGWVSFG